MQWSSQSHDRAQNLTATKNCGPYGPDLAQLGLLTDDIAHLALPLEAGGTLYSVVNEALDHITSMHVYCAQRDQLLSVQFAEVAINELNQA
jgi:hypothetical protein